MTAPAVRIVGLEEAVKGLRAVNAALPKHLSQLHRKSALSIRDRARHKIPEQPVPDQQGMVSHFARATSAGLTLRYSKYPWAGGAEWGAKQFKQFKPWTGNQWTEQFPGYIVQPTIGESLPGVQAAYAQSTLELFNRLIPSRVG